MIRSLYYTDAASERDLSPEALQQAIQSQSGLLWLDIHAEPIDASESLLRTLFGFHPLAIEDALRQSHVPRVDDWEQYLFLVLHAVDYQPGIEARLVTHEVDIFLGPNYLVTQHATPVRSLELVWGRCQEDHRYHQRGPDHLLYLLAEELVTEYMAEAEQMDEALEKLEGQIFDRPTSNTLEAIFGLKRGLLRMRRIISPQREIFNKLARDSFQVVQATERVYFRDVYDHLVRLHDIIESMRDQVSGALEIYLSVLNNRLSEVMKILTVITTLFMPIAFITSFFGMNVFLPRHPIDIWGNTPVLAITIGLILLAPLTMLIWARRNNWM
jgi:magnesium transporter